MSDQITQPVMEEMPADKPARKTNIWLIFGVILLLCILFSCCVLILLAFMGPVVGNVFSNILEQMTPVP
jgi:hypothetical protein